jgi:hypothetical protein
MGRSDVMLAVRGVIDANLPEGFVPVRHYAGMDCWAVPADRSPRGRGRAPLVVVGLGERKTYVSLFLMGLYYDPAMRRWFDDAWRAADCPLRRGKIAVQLRELDDVPLDVVADAVRWFTVDDLVAAYERDRAGG